MNRSAIVWLPCCLALFAADARGQTDLSLRIRSLGTSLGGVVDDYLTDAFLYRF
ncbi:MAG: hypothetical protein ACE5EO_04385 [Candidatus Krumholzibacteriia bacterium]